MDRARPFDADTLQRILDDRLAMIVSPWVAATAVAVEDLRRQQARRIAAGPALTVHEARAIVRS